MVAKYCMAHTFTITKSLLEGSS